MVRGFLFFLLAGVACLSSAQEPPSTFRDQAVVTSVLIPVTVRDTRGRLVAHLEREAFRLFIDDMEFPIRSFWREGGLPIAYAFVVDTSGSMHGRRLAQVQAAIREFLKGLKAGDEVSLLTFGAGEVHRRLRFGADPSSLPPLLERLTGYGTTALYDVLAAAPRFFQGTRAVRRAVLLFTDGVDTASQLTPEGTLQILEEVSDPVYVFGIEPPPGELAPGESYEALLRRFAQVSGGRYVRVEKLEELASHAAELRRELSMRYIISLTPSGVGEVKWRRLRVEVKGPYRAVARQGYRGTLP